MVVPVQVICPSVLLMESNAGQENLKQAMVTVRNAGSTVLFLSWSRVPRGETIVSINGHSGGGGNDPEGNGGCSGHEGSCAEREEVTSNEAAAARHKALQEPRDRFFCYQVSYRLELIVQTVHWGPCGSRCRCASAGCFQWLLYGQCYNFQRLQRLRVHSIGLIPRFYLNVTRRRCQAK